VQSGRLGRDVPRGVSAPRTMRRSFDSAGSISPYFSTKASKLHWSP
jgi:hypothetical protein